MPALNYKIQFADLVESGLKRLTIRAKRKYPIKIGDCLYHYTGMRTKACRKLREDICTMEREIRMTDAGVKLEGVAMAAAHILQLAKADGFESVEQFRDFFKRTHNFPFVGQLIEW